MTIRDKVDRAIELLLHDFDRYPHKYLTEEDVRFHLCLLLHEDFGNLETTQDGGLSIALHSEIRWWGPNQSKFRSDIVIFNVQNLCVNKDSLRRQRTQIPGKGYSSDSPKVAIELKLRRVYPLESDRVFQEKIESDINKLQTIERQFDAGGLSVPLLYVIAFDKRQRLAIPPATQDNIVVHYRFSTNSQN
jgi:hypothetical protein